MTRNSLPEAADPATVAAHLVEAARLDPAFRDLYLEQARTLLARLFTYDGFLSLKKHAALVDESLLKSRAAIEHGDWESVRRLAVRIAALRRELDEKGRLLELGEEVYAPQPVVSDPFSPGLLGIFGHGGKSRAHLRDEAVRLLEALAAEEPAGGEWYAARRSFFLDLVLDESEEQPRQEARRDIGAVKDEMLRALESGDMARIESLLGAVEERGSTKAEGTAGKAAAAGRVDEEWAIRLGKPFPADAVNRSQRLGLALARLAPEVEMSEQLYQAALHPDLPEATLSREGGARSHGHASAGTRHFSEALREKMEFFRLHPFVTSAGARYLPRMVEEEVLVEDFAEGEEGDSPSPLGAALGFDRRRALSREEVERSLLAHGPVILRDELGLDPREFRLVCIPHDVYCRLGRQYHWGERRLWTHFDGYQVLRDGRFRALVGGDVRFGGLQDLCGIGVDDERDGVVARFAVVRRVRLM